MAECIAVDPDCRCRVVARGMCNNHYTQWHRATNAKSAVCERCGSEFKADRASRRFCSPVCSRRSNGEQARPVWEALRRSRLPVLFVGARMVCDVPLSHPSRSQRFRSGRVFVSGACARCGEQFTIVDQLAARFCSARCAQRTERARTERFRIASRVRLAIYERDDWTCQLCLEPIDSTLNPLDSWAASLDHIECQSWVLFPDHSPQNLRACHRMCNSLRGNREDSQWSPNPSRRLLALVTG